MFTEGGKCLGEGGAKKIRKGGEKFLRWEKIFRGEGKIYRGVKNEVAPKKKKKKKVIRKNFGK